MRKGGTSSGFVLCRFFALVSFLGGVVFPFDGKFLLLWAMEVVHEYFSRKQASIWRTRLQELQARAQAPKKRVAVILDGSSRGGRALKELLVSFGYTVIYPSEKGEETEHTLGIRTGLDREESAEIFIKKITQSQKNVDLLIVNLQRYKKHGNNPTEIKGVEKKIVPSKKKRGFISKRQPYRDVDRVLLEKDPNVRKNYLLGFLLIRGLAPALKSGEGRVVINACRVFNLLGGEYAPSLFPSAFFSFSYSQMCTVLLAFGAKARYHYLDVSVVSTSLLFSEAVNSFPRINRLVLSASDPGVYATCLVSAALSERNKDVVSYYDTTLPRSFAENLGGYDRANDLWEQAEMIS
ncbi:hypothetical protein NEDG_00672 [Nematocida displodere]|uniref:Uncharacterized protein n=1 Tax=Nematocida displodere TaxID=1805483 RepID=A0A177EEX1_9MICR|nr:hypothetical protein NEDG_00672 [Nematocida displodere]